jgi:hypothetical protein
MTEDKAQSAVNGYSLNKDCNAGLGYLWGSLWAQRAAIIFSVAYHTTSDMHRALSGPAFQCSTTQKGMGGQRLDQNQKRNGVGAPLGAIFFHVILQNLQQSRRATLLQQAIGCFLVLTFGFDLKSRSGLPRSAG